MSSIVEILLKSGRSSFYSKKINLDIQNQITHCVNPISDGGKSLIAHGLINLKPFLELIFATWRGGNCSKKTGYTSTYLAG